MNLTRRAAAHGALGDERRLVMVDHLATGDLNVAELADISGMRGNLLAHHLDVLESAGLIERRTSEGDHRRRYVTLRWEGVPNGYRGPQRSIGTLAFLCTHNSARSQFAAALWEKTTGKRAESAGTRPASRVHPMALRVAGEFDVDLSGRRPGGYERLSAPSLVVTVCDKARESELPPLDVHLHWSVPDPVPAATVPAFRTAFAEIAERVGHLADQRIET